MINAVRDNNNIKYMDIPLHDIHKLTSKGVGLCQILSKYMQWRDYLTK